MDQTILRATEMESAYLPPAGLLRTAALFVCLLSASGGACAQFYLDLTTEIPMSSDGPAPAPGGGFDGTPRFPFPVEVTLQDFYPPTAESESRVTAVILIRNVGKEPLSLPASRDFSVLKAGNQGQRWLAIALTITPPAPHKPIEPSLGATLVGSESVPGSLLVLAPQQSVTIRMQTSLAETSKWHDAGLDTAKVAVSVNLLESYLDSNEYRMTSFSPMVHSKNEIELFWHY